MEQDLDAMLSRINHLTGGGDPNGLNPTAAPQTGSELQVDAMMQRPPAPPTPPAPGGMAPLPPNPAGHPPSPPTPPMPGTPGVPGAGYPGPSQNPVAMPGQPGPQYPGSRPPVPTGTQFPPNMGPGGVPQQPMSAMPPGAAAHPGQAPQAQPPGIMRVNQARPANAPGPGQAGPPATAAPGVPQQNPGISPAVAPVAPAEPAREEFFPTEPKTLKEAHVTETLLEELVVKYLLTRGEDCGKGISDQVKMPYPFIQELLARLKYDQMIYFKDTAHMGDYICSLTDKGRERGRGMIIDCTYFGAAPVSLPAYCESVANQSLNHQNPTEENLREAFSDLLVNPSMFLKLGSAMNSGRGMFLFGFPGNGKTSIAERVTKAFGEFIWIPRAIGVDGEIIRVFDPSQHTEAPLEDDDTIVAKNKIDKRWVRIERPTLIVGGELTMDNLEMSINRDTGINEAPIQLKSNCGTLVIDDFGRQRMSTDELLNRWIVPLEKRYDFLNLPSGKKIQVPFDQLVVFSTNLEPKDLVDDAFLRRIPYKIEVENPTEVEFRELFKIMCPLMGFEHDKPSIDYLIKDHYLKVDRPFRCCQPRDLLLQIKNYCKYMRRPMILSNENFDFAAENYFSVM